MARDVSDATPIGARDELVAWIAEGEKPREAWRLGTEHEKVPFYRSSHAPVPYEGETGIRALLDGLSAETGWDPILDRNNIIGLYDAARRRRDLARARRPVRALGRAARDDPRYRRRARPPPRRGEARRRADRTSAS